MTADPTSGAPGLARFNALPAQAAQHALLACCASVRWATQVAADRPYPSPEALSERAGTAFGALEWPEIEQALTAHPRIGDRPAGAGREAAWSRGEQAGVMSDDQQALRAANLAYEERFGRVFLICATGRTGPEMLAALRDRLQNDEATERQVVRIELLKIVRLRLTKLLSPEEQR